MMNTGKPISILFLTFQGDIAGSTNSISYLCKGLSKKGHTIVIGCRKESLLYRLLDNTKVVREPMTFKSRFDWKNINQINRIVKKYNIQIINAQSGKDRYTSVLAKWIFRLPVKVVHTRRQISESIGGFLQNLIYYRGTDKIVAVSEGVKNSLMEKGIPEKHIKVIYNGTPKEKYNNIDPEKVAELRRLYQIKEGDFVLGCISRKKKQEQILHALTKIDFPVSVIFAGITFQPEYESIIQTIPVQHKIHFTGLIPSGQILNYYKILSIKILASTMEGLSQALLEGMALEVPVIATHAAGNPELVIDGENGFTFNDGDIDDLAKKIKILREDQEIRRKFIENGKKTAFEQFSIENTINQYETFYQRLI
ncbi:MAG: glycosyltransferase family 4 protein [Cyclobacteriaceae bacterium]